jgi:chromosome segregation ATPase
MSDLLKNLRDIERDMDDMAVQSYNKLFIKMIADALEAAEAARDAADKDASDWHTRMEFAEARADGLHKLYMEYVERVQGLEFNLRAAEAREQRAQETANEAANQAADSNMRATAAEARAEEAEGLVEDWLNEHGGSGPTISLLERSRALVSAKNRTFSKGGTK